MPRNFLEGGVWGEYLLLCKTERLASGGRLLSGASISVQVSTIPIFSNERCARFCRLIAGYTRVNVTFFRFNFFFKHTIRFLVICAIFNGFDFRYRRSIIRTITICVYANEPTRQFTARHYDCRFSESMYQALRKEASARNSSINATFNCLDLSFSPLFFDRNENASSVGWQFAIRLNNENVCDRLFAVATMNATVFSFIKNSTRILKGFATRTNTIRNDRYNRL